MKTSTNPVGNPIITSARESMGTGEAATDYSKFENLTRKLVAVPKAEVDAQRSEA
jgi:hypothetical protein